MLEWSDACESILAICMIACASLQINARYRPCKYSEKVNFSHHLFIESSWLYSCLRLAMVAPPPAGSLAGIDDQLHLTALAEGSAIHNPTIAWNRHHIDLLCILSRVLTAKSSMQNPFASSDNVILRDLRQYEFGAHNTIQCVSAPVHIDGLQQMYSNL